MGLKMKEVKLCMLGDADVGKSCIAYQFVNGAFNSNSDPTLGAAFCSRSIQVNNIICKFQIWDTAGMEKYRSLMPMYYRGSSAVVIVYDITEERTFESVKKWIGEVKNQADPDVFLCIVGNKLDLESLRDVKSEDAVMLAESQKAIFFETSAKLGYNVSEMFHEIANRLSVAQKWEETASYCIQPRPMSELYVAKKPKKMSENRRRFCSLL